MRVQVSGDLLVKGSIERAKIQVGNDLTVLGGIFGTLDAHAMHGTREPEGADLDGGAALDIEVGGSLAARFINLAYIRVGRDMIVREYIGNSRIFAQQWLLLGQQGGKGVLFGGFSHALLGASLVQLGNDSYLATQLKLGDVEALELEQAALRRKQQTRQHEANQLAVILDKIKNQGSPQTLGQVTLDKARKIGNTIKAIEQRLQEVALRLREIDSRITEQRIARLVVRKALYPGVLLNINGVQKAVTTVIGASQWLCADGQIISAS
jgi:uncharacterized protein (DUF342 family)